MRNRTLEMRFAGSGNLSQQTDARSSGLDRSAFSINAASLKTEPADGARASTCEWKPLWKPAPGPAALSNLSCRPPRNNSTKLTETK